MLRLRGGLASEELALARDLLVPPAFVFLRFLAALYRFVACTPHSRSCPLADRSNRW